MLDMLLGCSGAAEVSNQATSNIHGVTSNPVQEEKTVECMSHALSQQRGCAHQGNLRWVIRDRVLLADAMAGFWSAAVAAAVLTENLISSSCPTSSPAPPLRGTPAASNSLFHMCLSAIQLTTPTAPSGCLNIPR